MNVVLNLTSEDIDAILYALGELPSKTDVWPLAYKIKQQVANQDKEPSE